MRKILSFVLAGIVLPVLAFAAETNPEIFFKNDEHKVLVVKLLKKMDKEQNECSSRASCLDLYALDFVGRGAPPRLPNIDRVDVSTSGNNLELTLDDSLMRLESVRLTLKQLKLRRAADTTRKELLLGPSVYLDSDSSNGIVYQGRFRLKEKPNPEKVTVNIEAVDEATDVSADFKVRVLSVDHYSQGAAPELDNLWLIKVTPNLPRGKTVNVTVSGIDSFDGTVFEKGKGGGKVDAYPKGRDDADYYLRGQYIFNQAAKDEGSIDFKVEKRYFIPASALDYWYKVEATVGSKSLDVSQSGTVSAGRTWWFNVDDPKKTAWSVSLAPTFKTDRDFKNRDLGADLTFDSKPGFLYQPLETKRREHPDDPNLYGWWIVPKFAVESGWHLASSSAEVDGTGFERGVAGVNLMWERASPFAGPFATLRLTVDAAARYLFQDEVLSDSGSIVKTDKGYVPYLKAELAYDLGPVAVSIVHENGRLPPDFKRAHATTVGVTVKF